MHIPQNSSLTVCLQEKRASVERVDPVGARDSQGPLRHAHLGPPAPKVINDEGSIILFRATTVVKRQPRQGTSDTCNRWLSTLVRAAADTNTAYLEEEPLLAAGLLKVKPVRKELSA